MKLCRYDDDRLGVVRGSMVHDVTEAQTQIRAAAPYAMKGDAVIAALPAWRARLEEMASKAPGKPMNPMMEEFLRFVLSRDGQQVILDHARYVPLRASQAATARALLSK